MKKALIVFCVIFTLAAVGGVFIILSNNQPPKPDTLTLNKAVQDAFESGDRTEVLRILNETLAEETQRMAAANKSNEIMQTVFLCVFILLFIIMGAGLYLYCYKTILKPFEEMETFASRVAQGDLSFPLEMDRENRFGAFTESFDLMREQLVAARENERLADISKKELVASLSHDVKTPVSSIKVIAELFVAKHGEADEMESIIRKADQIDLLVSNMFAAALEDLKQLKVTPTEIATNELEEIIFSSDYQKKIKPFALPECIVMADGLRFRQVVDNIIGNSYKYAGTDIEVTGDFDGDNLALTIRDFGSGVSDEELALLCEKFYRAGNAEGKGGSGLGLYLSKYFITEMGGSIELKSENGFWATIYLKI